jgi:hypothetical protein
VSDQTGTNDRTLPVDRPREARLLTSEEACAALKRAQAVMNQVAREREGKSSRAEEDAPNIAIGPLNGEWNIPQP